MEWRIDLFGNCVTHMLVPRVSLSLHRVNRIRLCQENFYLFSILYFVASVWEVISNLFICRFLHINYFPINYLSLSVSSL